jgi:hypothetical protein
MRLSTPYQGSTVGLLVWMQYSTQQTQQPKCIAVVGNWHTEGGDRTHQRSSQTCVCMEQSVSGIRKHICMARTLRTCPCHGCRRRAAHVPMLQC